MTSTRGVTLIEGMISTVILLTGIVGVLQGIIIASQQNSMANRHTRASIIAQELITAIEHQGRTLNLSATGVFDSSRCSSAGSLPTAVQPFVGELTPIPASFAATTVSGGLGWTGTTACYVNFDALTGIFPAMTPGYSTQDNTTYTRVVAAFQNPSNPEVMFVGVSVGWRDGGRNRILTRMTAMYDIGTNQTNLEF